ncbi:MAG: translation initiation factor IF-3 [Candidatus Eisenbacteria bacterium]
MNDKIRAPMVRVVGDDGNQLGVMAISDALRMAREMGQDLVEVAPNAKPPVCRVMDYGKYKYQQSKRDAMAKKRQHQTQVKEVKLRPKIERHDFETKMRNARKFLGERDKVKVTVMFRGREMSHPQLGYELLQAVIVELADIGQVEQNPSAEGRTITMMLSPLPQGAKTSSKGAAEDE